MERITAILLSFVVSCVCLSVAQSAEPVPGAKASTASGATQSVAPIITLPLKVHLVRNFEVVVGEGRLTTWITPEDVQNVVVPEINRIWSQAGIKWNLVKIDVVEYEMPRTDELALMIGTNTRARLRVGSSDVVRALNQFAKNLGAGDGSYRLVAMPYLANTLQGLAFFPRRLIYVTSWTDKPSHGQKSPQKIALVEPEPYRIGSFVQTAAHELGHLLGLHHDNGCDRNCLMTNKFGYRLTEMEIATAREHAEASERAAGR